MGPQAIARRVTGIGPSRDARRALESLRRLVRFLRLAARQTERVHGLTAAQLFVLGCLARSPARSLAELAERTLTDQSSVSTVVARLVERGLIVRRRAAADARRTELALSIQGRATIERSPDLVQERILDAIARMPAARRRSLIDALEGLVRDIGADDLAPRMLFEDEVPVTAPRRRRSRDS